MTMSYCKTGNFGVIKLWRNLMQRILTKEMLMVKNTYFCFILYAYFAWLFYFERLKFGDLPNLSKFLVLQYSFQKP